MITQLLRSVFGNTNDRLVKKFSRIVPEINALEDEVSKLSDDELKARTPWLKERLSKGETLDHILPDAFATMREAAKRVLGQRHYDVQLIGGMILNSGMIAEMNTGEGKTLVSTLPAYLNALTGKGVHIVTVNDYLASRDAEWMGSIYRFLGLTVGCIIANISDEERKAAYQCDITYGTNNEFGFDYLRDNMKFSIEDMVQRPFGFAVVDEVDSILIDEARTPLIISGPAEDSSELYMSVDKVIPSLSPEDIEKDEKARAVTLTESGMHKMEELLKEAGLLEHGGLYDAHNTSLVHHVNQSLKAHHLFTRDVDYIVKNNKVIIIDEFTGRMMDGRRYSDGLHQAIEAKENATIQVENQTLASITFQNYFRLYPKLAGMAGTAMTEAPEFEEIYGLQVVAVPTNKPCIRIDEDDEIYRTEAEKLNAVVEKILECQKRGQPVLVGTVSIEKSEVISAALKKHKIKHNVLNARHHEQEAYIVANAGRLNAVTVATNMAGRGTDIHLGGNIEMTLEQELTDKMSEKERTEKATKIEKQILADREKVREAGGLFIIGTERHESRRIDNQLRGRAARQGDPGASHFYLSLQDDLMRIFGSDRMDNMLVKLGIQEGEAITHPWINKAIARAQQKVEARNFEIRKQLLKYDDVMNEQRKAIYSQRKEIMGADSLSEMIEDMRDETLIGLINRFAPQSSASEKWAVSALHEEVVRIFGLNLPLNDWAQEEDINQESLYQKIHDAILKAYVDKKERYGSEIMAHLEHSVSLQALDHLWKDHLLTLDHLRQGINLRAYGQRDPLNEYKHEAFMLFEQLLYRLREQVTLMMSHVELSAPQEEPEKVAVPKPKRKKGKEKHLDLNAEKLDFDSVPRNAQCPCGSGLKFKYCHGKIEA